MIADSQSLDKHHECMGYEDIFVTYCSTLGYELYPEEGTPLSRPPPFSLAFSSLLRYNEVPQ